MSITFNDNQFLRALLLNAAVLNMAALSNQPITLSNYTGSTYTDVAGGAMRFNKVSTDTDLVIPILFTAWAQGTLGAPASMQIIFGVECDGATTDAGYFNFNSVSDHMQIAGCAHIQAAVSGLIELKFRAKRTFIGSGGTAGLTMDTGDRLHMLVMEVG